MNRLRITTPSRLHFGLLAWGPDAPRQFGGVGLMIDRPGIELTAELAGHWHAQGPLAERALRVAERVVLGLRREGALAPPMRFQIHHAPAEHVGLGVGTQLSLAVTRAIIGLAGLADPPLATLADLAGRGLRSGIGLHGFLHGGLIVDGGRQDSHGIPPLLARFAFPPDWHALVILPASTPGLHGAEEIRAFIGLPAVPDALTDRLCRLVLLGLLPAVVEHDLRNFGAALEELQHHVGLCFAPAQGGAYARPESEAIVSYLRDIGLHGVGQSSWGPALYGFSQADEAMRGTIAHRVRALLDRGADQVFWTDARPDGARLLTE